MGKKACKMDKKELKKLRKKPVVYTCKKCEITAHKEKKLCKPKPV
jgi:hypothetical protein